MGTRCETICRHRILFPFIQHLAWLPQGRPQGKQKCGKNSKNINLRRYFKFNREGNCNTSIQTFICPMCTPTLCNLFLYPKLVLYHSLLWTYCLRFLTKSPTIPQQLYKTASRSLSAIAQLLDLFCYAYFHSVNCTSQCLQHNKNLAIANRSRVSCAHNTLRASIGINITPWPWNQG